MGQDGQTWALLWLEASTRFPDFPNAPEDVLHVRSSESVAYTVPNNQLLDQKNKCEKLDFEGAKKLIWNVI